MSTISVFLAEGFEEIEALTVVDICRRAGLDTKTVSITDNRTVISSHAIPVVADLTLDEVDFDALNCIVLPGGIPGTPNLEACETLMKQVDAFYEAGVKGEDKYLAAICAAPSILGHKGFLKGRNATCYPFFESHLEGAIVNHADLEVSDHIITGRGMGTAIVFGLAIASVFAGKEKADAISEGIMYSRKAN